MWEKQSTLIRASAGSGKTYQLSLRYLALMALNEAPREIIALTFTRKAAGEFTYRILQMLADGASSDKAAEELAGKIRTTWFGSPEGEGGNIQPGLLAHTHFKESQLPPLNRRHFLRMLRTLVDDLGRLNLSTLDSFFGNMAQSLAPELGIGGLRMIDESRKELIQKEVLHELFSQAMEEAEGRDEFIEAYRLSTLSQEEDRTEETLLDFVNRYHERYGKAPLEKQWGYLPLVYVEGYSWSKPELALTEFAEQVEEVKAALVLMNQSDAWKRDRGSFLDSFAEYGRSGKAPKIPTAYLPDAPFWTGVPLGSYVELYRKKEIDLGSLAGAGIVRLIRSWVQWEVSAASAQTRGIYALMSRYEALYERSVRSQGLFSFDDIVRLLLQAGEESDEGYTRLQQAMNDVRFRMDGWYRHWMLDEFQDTSRDQWNIVSPLMREVASDTSAERTLFIVGDPKQSIYQWRGGEPRLFDELGEEPLWKARLKKWEMDISYRSSPVVLDFANKVCCFQDTAPEARYEALRRWEYAEHTSSERGKSLSGHIQVWSLPSDAGAQRSEGEGNGGVKAFLPALTALLRRTNPLGRGLSCAIMVGKNKDAEMIAHWLRSEEGGDFLAEMDSDAAIGEDSPLGAALADFFRWLLHPGDCFAWNHVRLSPLRRWLSTEDGGCHEWEKWTQLMERRGISGVVRQWAEHFNSLSGILLNSFQKDRLNAWLRAAEDYDREGGDPVDWISVMEKIRRKEHSGAGAIQIMTWHKAKGLEFDMVILPDIKTRAFADKGHMDIISRLDEKGSTEAFILKPAQSSYDYDESLCELVEDWSAQQEYEGFCKLYVALTRAKRATYVFLPPRPQKSSGNCSAASILFSACDQSSQSRDDNLEGTAETCLYESGSSDWFLSSPSVGNSPPVLEIKDTPLFQSEFRLY